MFHGIVRRVAPREPATNGSGAFVTCCLRSPCIGASLESYASLCRVLQEVLPHECYHLAGPEVMSVILFDDEFSTMRTNVQGTHELLARREAG